MEIDFKKPEKNETVFFRASKEMAKELKELAEKYGISQSELLRQLVEELLKSKKE